MTPAHAGLYQRLLAFEFDVPGTSRPFVVKLAREQRWPDAFAARAVFEYRRFCFLACAAGRPMCPSDAVDRVWHLHLTYTRSYWERFCPEVLRTPLHHDPSGGGPAEAARHRAMYADTLAAYREHFGEEPPADIWPPPAARFGRPRRVPARAAGLLLASAVAALGCVGVAKSPFDLPGGEFLITYMIFLIIALVFARLLRRMVRWVPVDESAGDAVNDPYALAYLAGGANQAVAAAVVRLMDAGHLKAGTDAGKLVEGKPLPADSPPLEHALRSGAGPGGRSLFQLRWLARAEAGAVGESLREAGLVMSAARQNVAWLVALATVLALPLLLGLPKIIIGQERGKPVGFLVLLCIASVVAAFCVTLGSARTLAGDRALARLRDRHRRLERPADRGRPPADLLLGVALFGPTVLAPDHAARDFVSPAGTGGGSDGGGSDGGGGDGGGGGGCGGCGGGGGGD